MTTRRRFTPGCSRQHRAPRPAVFTVPRRAPRPRGLAILALTAALLAGCASTKTEPDWERPLPPGAPALIPLGADEEHPDIHLEWYGRHRLVDAVERSLSYLAKPSSLQHFPQAGISHERTRASLERFAELLAEAGSAEAFERAVDAEFQWYRSAGWDGRGSGVLFTGYCTPILEASLRPTQRFKYPLYGRPDDLITDPNGKVLGQKTSAGTNPKYPTRGAIERGGLLDGTEVAWLASPMDAYIAHVNGSAVLRLPNDELFRVGFAGHNGHEYTSLRELLVKAEALDGETANLASIREWAKRSPGDVLDFLHRNDRYVFFREIEGTPHGSLNVPVAAKRTLATDKSVFPRASLLFVDTRLPRAGTERGVPFRRFMLDQDTGGAIRSAGRADIYLGEGDEAEGLAGATKAPGQLYYLFLREGAGVSRVDA